MTYRANIKDEIECITPSWGAEVRELARADVPLEERCPPMVTVEEMRQHNGKLSKDYGKSGAVARRLRLRLKCGDWVKRRDLEDAAQTCLTHLVDTLGAMVARGEIERRRAGLTTEYRKR